MRLEGPNFALSVASCNETSTRIHLLRRDCSRLGRSLGSRESCFRKFQGGTPNQRLHVLSNFAATEQLRVELKYP